MNLNAYEERKQLMDHATLIYKELRDLNSKFQQIAKPIGQLVANLIAAGDALMLDAADVKDNPPKVTKVTMEMVGIPAVPTLKAGKRACSLCRKPGHRATACPDAHIVRQNKKERKPLSPERKAQLAENLKKARAARKVK